MDSPLYIDGTLCLALIGLVLLVAHYTGLDRMSSLLKRQITKDAGARASAEAAHKLLSQTTPHSVDASRSLLLGYERDVPAARLMLSSLQARPDPQWTEILVELAVQRNNSEIRHLAVQALEPVQQTERTLSIFKQLFLDSDAAVSNTAAWVLAKAGQKNALAYLLESAASDEDIERVARPSSGGLADYARSHEQMFNRVHLSEFPEADCLKLGMLLLTRIEEYPEGVVDELFRLRNRGTYLALALSLENGLLLNSETLRTLARLGYPQVAGRLSDDLQRFARMGDLPERIPPEEVWAAKLALEKFVNDLDIQISPEHLEKIANMPDFEFRCVHTSPNPPFEWTDPPVAVVLSGLREAASDLMARHTAFWSEPEEEIAA